MKQETREFARRVVLTTGLAFLLISFFFIGVIALFDSNPAKYERFVFFRYILGKLFCIFLFSLSLGFINRIPEMKKPVRAVRRLIHFFAALLSFGLTMILLFYTLFEGVDSLTVQGAMLNLVLFLLFYFIVLGVTALGRRVFLKEKPAPYKSILD